METRGWTTWRGRFAAAWIALAVFVGAGCSALPPCTIHPDQVSADAVTLDLPIVHQDTLYTCGLASVSALCQYWNVDIPVQRRNDLSQTAERKEGLSGRELREALEELGMDAFLFRGTLDRSPTGLYGQVDQGRPPLVMISPDSSGHHYCLVLGYDEPRGNVFLLDPVRGQVIIPTAVFDREWARCQRFTLLACPKEKPALALGSSRLPKP